MEDAAVKLLEILENYRKEIFGAADFIWRHPEPGYFEWETDGYLSKRWEERGLSVVRFGNIPGFYADLSTGREGPTVCLLAELDALEMPNHPEQIGGYAHACGHHIQSAALLGIMYALTSPGALTGLSGTIRLMQVPAEEIIQLEKREELRQKGVIRYFGGKQELIARGYFDDVDIAFLVHASCGNHYDYGISGGHNGIIIKDWTYFGKATHAGGFPEGGINAQYASVLGLNACNAVRETFSDKDQIRFHPIELGIKTSVNIIPSEARSQAFLRAKSVAALKRENRKLNRALAGAAVSMGARLEIHDRPGYMPSSYDRNMIALMKECAGELAGEERVLDSSNIISSGSSDFADLASLIPGIHPQVFGASGHAHGDDFLVEDPEETGVRSARLQLRMVWELLKNNAERAKKIKEEYKPLFKSKEEYTAYLDGFLCDRDAVKYEEKGIVVNPE